MFSFSYTTSFLFLLLLKTSSATTIPKPQATTSSQEIEIQVNEEIAISGERSDPTTVAIWKLTDAVHQLSASIAGSLKELERYNDKNFKELARSIDNKWKDILQCPAPWIQYEQMCFWFSYERMDFSNARGTCAKRGGDLAWISNKAEHEAIQSFIRKTFPSFNWWFRIGLFRTEKGREPLIWTGGNKSSYRGIPFEFPSFPSFFARMKDTKILGDPHYVQHAFLCRR